MNCAEANQKIELFVLGELSISEQAAIKVHLIACPVCNATEAEYRLLVTKIEEAAQPAPPKFAFVRRIQSAVKAEIRSIALLTLLRRIIAIIGSAAACLLLVVVIRQTWILSGKQEGHLITKRLVKEPLGRVLSTLGAPTILEAWQYRGTPSVPGSMANEVVVHRQNVYLLQEHDRQIFVVACDTKTGKQKWLSGIHTCGYILADDSRVYCLSPSGAGKLDLIALDAANGEVLWKYQQQYTEQLQNPCRPILFSEGRICWTLNNTVHMFNCATGKSLWTHSIPDGGLLSAAVVAGNNLYVAYSFGFYCLNATTGNELWRLDCGGITSSRSRPLLAAANGKIYASFTPGFGTSRLICMEPTGRRIRWSKTVSHATHLYAIDNMLYLRNQNIQALDGITGRLLWSYQATGCNPVTYTDGLAYFVDSSSQGCLKALNRYTGSKVWELVGMKSCNAFIKVDSTGFLKNQNGIVYAIDFKG
ncbi:MAG: PQQ-binding-like beta-propeller repeat protein [Planctomycetes bacterium]|nr:PQQ-binding-like beta-propeller repeat protein [Planctomycetota bacterium]